MRYTTQFEAKKQPSPDDCHIEGGAILLGRGGTKKWREEDREFQREVGQQAKMLHAVMSEREIFVFSSDGDKIMTSVDEDATSKPGWFAWYPGSLGWLINWGSAYQGSVQWGRFSIFKRGRGERGGTVIAEGVVAGALIAEADMAAARAYVEGYLRAWAPDRLEWWKKFAGRGVRGTVLKEGS